MIDTHHEPGSQARSRLDALVGAFPLAIIGINRDGVVAEWNLAATQMIGWSAREVFGHPLPCIPATQQAQFDSEMRRAFLPTTSSGFSINETQWLRRDGTTIDVSVWTSPLRNREGITSGLLLVASDISARKRVEAVLQQALRDAEEGRALLDTVISEAPVGIALFDHDFRFVRVNAALAQINGIAAEMHAGVHGSAIVPDLWSNIEPGLQAILSGSKQKVSIQFSGQTRAAPGVSRTWIYSFYPVRIASGQIIGAGVIVEEITLQKRATVLVDGQKLALELMVQNAPLEEVLGVLTSIIEEQASGRCVASIIMAGEGSRLRLGAGPTLSPEMIADIDGREFDLTTGNVGRVLLAAETVVCPDFDQDPNWQAFLPILRAAGLKSAWSTPIVASTGEVLGAVSTYFREARRPTQDEVRTVQILSHTAAVAIERRRAEEALIESEQRFRLMADSTPAIVWTTDAEGHTTYLNTQWHRFTGQLPELGMGLQWEECFHPDDIEPVKIALREARATRSTFRAEHRLRRHDGVFCWMISAASPRFSESGEFLGHVGSTFDITDRQAMEEELRASTERLRYANAAKDEFLGMVSHELRTPITVILGQSDLLTRKEDFFDPETKREMMDDIHRESLRLYQIIENLLALARLEQGQRAEMEPVIIDRMLMKILESFRKTNPRHHLRLEVDNVPLALGSSIYIEQIMRNLISNACKYSPVGQPILVTAGQKDGRVHLTVRDHGPGVPPEERERIFAPFYRSDKANPHASGFGIGLAVCRRLSDAMDATIDVESPPEGGSVFSISLAIADE